MVTGSIQIRELEAQDVPACETILYSLPDWFGIEESNRAYINSLRVSPSAVATDGEQVLGFIALTKHTSDSYEINVMAVRETMHRCGIGTALIRWAEKWCQERNIPWLHVKTRGPSTPDPAYDRTRQFYLAQGYAPLFESLTLWGPQDAALVSIKHISCGRSAA